MKLLLVILALAWAGLLVCIPARAQTTTERAISAVCPYRGAKAFAPFIDAASRRYMLHPVTIVAVMRVESVCFPDVHSKAWATGLMQILPWGPARNKLSWAELFDPETNIHTGARWLAMMSTWCGSLHRGLGAYATGKCDRGHRYARKVMAVVARIRRSIEGGSSK